MKDSRIGDKELLVAKNENRCGVIYRGLWPMTENEKLYKTSGRKMMANKISEKP